MRVVFRERVKESGGKELWTSTVICAFDYGPHRHASFCYMLSSMTTTTGTSLEVLRYSLDSQNTVTKNSSANPILWDHILSFLRQDSRPESESESMAAIETRIVDSRYTRHKNSVIQDNTIALSLSLREHR